jgi:hypothetical protein
MSNTYHTKKKEKKRKKGKVVQQDPHEWFIIRHSYGQVFSVSEEQQQQQQQQNVYH